jgi:predicted HAD superfamily hydrolase
LRKAKATGIIYKHIIDALNICPSNILHIGDNYNADYKRAIENKIKAVLYKQCAKQFEESSPRVKAFRMRHGGKLGSSILIAVLAIRWQKEILEGNKHGEYFKEIGYEYGGPAIYGYTRWIESEVKSKGLNAILFVARDGYTLQKVFDSFNNGIKTCYIYASRFLNLICRLDYAIKDKDQSNAIIDYFSKIDHEIGKMSENLDKSDWEQCHKFIQKHVDLFVKHATIERAEYRNYIIKLLKANDAKIGMVDTITGWFSSQKLLQSVLNTQIYGFYWSVIRMQMQMQMYAVSSGDVTYDQENCFTYNWNFIEFLMTAPEPPVIKIDNGIPIYEDNPRAEESNLNAIYPSVSQGAIEFANDINRIFDGADIFLESREIVNWINAFCDNPTKRDIVEMTPIKHGIDNSHNQYVPLFCDATVPCWKRKTLKKLIWRTKLQEFVLNVMSPIKIKMRGLRHLSIRIFPKLRRQFFVCRLQLTDKWFYDIIVGNEGK